MPYVTTTLYTSDLNKAQLTSPIQILKSRIRKLRYLSRIISLLISIATLIPITMTLHKFLTTEHVFKTITDPSGNIVTRTAWFHDSKVWPTYMYFAVAAISVLLNLAILCSYMCSVEKANKVAAVASAFTWCVLIGNLVVWCVAAGIYRSEKDKGGKHDDLWGWTCSAPAKAIQKDFAEVPFDRFCTIQVSHSLGERDDEVMGADVCTECELLYGMRAGCGCAVDGPHLHPSADAQQDQEEGAAVLADAGAVSDELLAHYISLLRAEKTRRETQLDRA
jgi:hypothetical protein